MLFSTKHAPHRDVENTSHSPQPEWLVGTQAPALLPSPTGSLLDRLQRRKNYVASLTEQPKADATNFLKCSGTQAFILHNLKGQ